MSKGVVMVVKLLLRFYVDFMWILTVSNSILLRKPTISPLLGRRRSYIATAAARVLDWAPLSFEFFEKKIRMLLTEGK